MFLVQSTNGTDCRYYARDNPNFFREAPPPLHSPKLIVWCAVSWKRIIGPFFFKNESGETINVDGRSYRSMLQTLPVPQIENDEDYQQGNMFFMQDGAPPHTSRENINVLQRCFPSKVISGRGDIQWPPRSPDITPCDFLLCGHLRAKVDSNPIEILRSSRSESKKRWKHGKGFQMKCERQRSLLSKRDCLVWLRTVEVMWGDFSFVSRILLL